MAPEPFSDSTALAQWVVSTLKNRGVDRISDWRMIEYWFQVELYRAAQAGLAGSWRHVGDYEHPYYTTLPTIKNSKTNTKWVDLVLAEPDLIAPDNMIWMELKDVGRSKATAINNAKRLGFDLAALWALDIMRTKSLWLDPLPHTLDRGRLKEWNRYGPKIDEANHFISQVVLFNKDLAVEVPPESIKDIWIKSFLSRCPGMTANPEFDIADADTDKFLVFGLVKALN